MPITRTPMHTYMSWSCMCRNHGLFLCWHVYDIILGTYMYRHVCMYVCACMPVCMCIQVYKHIHVVYIYTHTYIKLYNMRDYICMYGCTRIYIYIYIYLYIYTHTHTTYTYAYTYTPVYLCMYIYIHTARYMQHEPAQLSTLHAFLVYVFAVTR